MAAKVFYYDSSGTSEATITGGTHTGTTFTVAVTEVTNEHYINDMSIAGGITSVGAGDCIRIDFGDTISPTADFLLIYNTIADNDDLIIYTSASATATGGGSFAHSASTVGWNLLAFGNSSRYMFIESSSGTFTGGLTEIIHGDKLTFENEPDIGGSTQLKFATDINTSYGGVEYANKRHNPQSTYTLNFKNISQTFKDALATMEAVITDYKKFVYYDGSDYNYVRLDGPINFIEVAHQRYSASIKLREQLS